MDGVNVMSDVNVMGDVNAICGVNVMFCKMYKPDGVYVVRLCDRTGLFSYFLTCMIQEIFV